LVMVDCNAPSDQQQLYTVTGLLSSMDLYHY
jgi:hypothetical protein